MSNVSEELLQLRKRARRRLVGAIALVVFALIVLWTALDGEPPANLAASRPVEIESSSSNLASAVIAVPVVQIAASSTASVVQASEASVADAPRASEPVYRAASAASEVLPGKLVNKQVEQPTPTRKPVVKPTIKPTQKPQTRDPRQILEGRDEEAAKPLAGKFFVQVAAFADAAKAAQIVSKLKQAGLPAYSEKVNTAQGELTRVRIGPAQDRARAAEWLKKAQAAGVSGQVVGK